MPAEVVPDSPTQVSPELQKSTEPITTASPVPVPNSIESLARFAANSAVSFTSDPPRVKRSAPPQLLLPESIQSGDGVGPIADLSAYCGKLLVVTLGITDVVERSGLTVSVWGSKDQDDWGAKPLATFRQRQYCGVYSVLLNMAPIPDVRWVRVQWLMNRWGKGERTPSFGFEVFVEESGARVSGSAVA